MRSPRLLTFILVSVSLLIAGCGGEGEEAATTTTSDGSQTTATSAAPITTTTSAPIEDGPELAGTTWTVTHHASDLYPDVTNVWEGSEVTIAFSDDGTVSGRTGCNDYSGTYAVSGAFVTEPGMDEQAGQALTISDLSWTEVACESENLMEQEVEFLDALQRVEHWNIGQGFGGDEDLLLLSIEDGLMVEGTP